MPVESLLWNAFGNLGFCERVKARIEQRKKLNNDTVAEKALANHRGTPSSL